MTPNQLQLQVSILTLITTACAGVALLTDAPILPFLTVCQVVLFVALVIVMVAARRARRRDRRILEAKARSRFVLDGKGRLLHYVRDVTPGYGFAAPTLGDERAEWTADINQVTHATFFVSQLLPELGSDLVQLWEGDPQEHITPFGPVPTNPDARSVAMISLDELEQDPTTRRRLLNLLEARAGRGEFETNVDLETRALDREKMPPLAPGYQMKRGRITRAR